MTSSPSSDMEFCELLAAKCGRIDSGLKTGTPTDITHLLEEMPTNSETFELVARFCQGHELNLTAENVVPLSCLAHFLDMTESHCRNNLLRKALAFFEHKVLPSWNETVKAFRTTESILYEAGEIGILGACVESLISKALSDPLLLGDPTKKSCFDKSESEDDGFSRPSAKRKLFVLNWKSEELNTLSLRLYEPLMHEMVKRTVPLPHVAVSLCDYVRKWVLSVITEEEAASTYRRNSQREIVEAVERLLPDERGVVACSALSEMLGCANILEASSGCKEGLELRIGRDLDQAMVKDLLILSRGCSNKVRYDIESVRRILKHFYGNYTSADIWGLVKVAELVEEFLAETASDVDLEKEAFSELAKMSMEVSRGTQRSSDGIYKGIDVYLEKHRHLSESEREELCQVLDVHKMSREACDHAAKNERLPLRVVLQVLFVAQMELRDTIRRAEVEEEEEEEEEEEARLLGGGGEEKVAMEMKKMSRKIVELEREYGTMKRKMEIDDGSGRSGSVFKKTKVSLWKEMKRKFGCTGTTSINCNNCQLKRKRS